MNITPTTWVQSSTDHARHIRPQPTHLASSDEMSRCATCVHNRKTNNNEDGNQASSTPVFNSECAKHGMQMIPFHKESEAATSHISHRICYLAKRGVTVRTNVAALINK